jgi:hypothetical protein
MILTESQFQKHLIPLVRESKHWKNNRIEWQNNNPNSLLMPAMRRADTEAGLLEYGITIKPIKTAYPDEPCWEVIVGTEQEEIIWLLKNL